MEDLRALLDKASFKQRVGLGKILGGDSLTSKELIDQLRWNYQPWWDSALGREPTYREVIEHIVQHLQITSPSRYSTVQEHEIRIAQTILNKVWDKMTPEQRIELETELKKSAQKFDKAGSFAASSSMVAALTAANLSGFGIYLLASTSLGALTGAIGIALPFALYTTMSSALAVIIGPVGWIGLSWFALWKSGESNNERLTSAIVYICMLRSEVLAVKAKNSDLASSTSSRTRHPSEPPKVDAKYSCS